MSTYKTSAIVEEHSRILVAGVPFAPGTEVAITINLKPQAEEDLTSSDDPDPAAARERLGELFRTVKGFRNSPASRVRNPMKAVPTHELS